MVDGKTRLVGLIGWPVEHSLSPCMHNAAFDKLGLNWCYVPMPVAPERLGDALRGLAALGFAGVNVTVPHKETVVAYLDEIAPEAQSIGAVNTIVLREGRAIGHNTDVYGFLEALREKGFAPQGRRAVVLGAGGAARAVVYALASRGSQVVVLNRSAERAGSLVEALSPALPSASLTAVPLTMETLSKRAAEADLLVNATSVGMWPAESPREAEGRQVSASSRLGISRVPAPAACKCQRLMASTFGEVDRCPWPEDLALPSRLTVFDLVYSPPRTKLLEKALSAGAKTIGGLGMLVHQGAAAFRLWTGIEPPVEAMYEACR